MASNYTENYGLCQWEATDQVLRTEFNEDNAKVDEALKGTADVAQAAQVLAQAAYSPENSPFVVGSYTGDGTAKRKIELGFTPKGILVLSEDGRTTTTGSYNFYYGGLAVSGKNVASSQTGITAWISGETALAVTDNGFFVSEAANDHILISSNSIGKNYNYLAVR